MVVVSKHALCMPVHIIFYDKTLATFVLCKILILNVFTRKSKVLICLFFPVPFAVGFALPDLFGFAAFVAVFRYPFLHLHACAIKHGRH